MEDLNNTLTIDDYFNVLNLNEETAEEELLKALPFVINNSEIMRTYTLQYDNRDIFSALLKEKLIGAKNFEFIQKQYTSYFIDKLESYIEPRWFTACFMNNYNNSSIWGSYGNNHAGICMEYKQTILDSKFKMEVLLEKENMFADKHKELELQQVIYSKKLNEINFFSYIIKIMQKKDYIQKQWFYDENGNASEYLARFSSNKNSWLNEYNRMWLNAITIKDEVWKFEDEYRLVINDFWDDYPDSGIKLKYDFNDLISITFGIKTSTIDKYNIARIIFGKCEKYERNDFKFYQAYYDETSGKIEREEIPLLKSFQDNKDNLALYDSTIEQHAG